MLPWLDGWSSRIKGLEHAVFSTSFLPLFDEWEIKRCKGFFLIFCRIFSLPIQVPGCNVIISFIFVFIYIYILPTFFLSKRMI